MRFWRVLCYAMSLSLMLVLLVGCDVPAVAPGAVAASSEERISSPDVARGDLRELAAGNNAFALEL